MDKEREKLQVKNHQIGESRKTVFVIQQKGQRSYLLIPEGVEVRQILPSGELGPMVEIDFQKVEPGEFSAKNLETGEETIIKFDPNSNSLRKAV